MTFEERKIKEFDDRFSSYWSKMSESNILYGVDPMQINKNYPIVVDQSSVKHFLSSALSEYKEELLSKMPKEKYNLITEKRRLTYSDIDSAFNACLDKVNKIIKES